MKKEESHVKHRICLFLLSLLVVVALTACGSGEIYDGTFTHTVVDGFGVAAELLAENGIRVLGESELEAFLRE